MPRSVIEWRQAINGPVELPEQIALHRIGAHAGEIDIDGTVTCQINAIELPVIEQAVLITVAMLAPDGVLPFLLLSALGGCNTQSGRWRRSRRMTRQRQTFQGTAEWRFANICFRNRAIYWRKLMKYPKRESEVGRHTAVAAQRLPAPIRGNRRLLLTALGAVLLGIAGYVLLRDHSAVDSAQSQAAAAVSTSGTSTSVADGLPAQSSAMTAAQVVNIIDGATLDVRYGDGRIERVKLAGVDAPALDQPYGEMSRQTLQHALERQTVGILPRPSPVQGARHVAVILDGGDLAAILLEQGNVTLAPDSAQDSTLKPHEAVARAARRGIWGLPPAQQIPRCAWDGTC